MISVCGWGIHIWRSGCQWKTPGRKQLGVSVLWLFWLLPPSPILFHSANKYLSGKNNTYIIGLSGTDPTGPSKFSSRSVFDVTPPPGGLLSCLWIFLSAESDFPRVCSDLIIYHPQESFCLAGTPGHLVQTRSMPRTYGHSILVPPGYWVLFCSLLSCDRGGYQEVMLFWMSVSRLVVLFLLQGETSGSWHLTDSLRSSGISDTLFTNARSWVLQKQLLF